VVNKLELTRALMLPPADINPERNSGLARKLLREAAPNDRCECTIEQ